MTLPREVREALHVEAGDDVAFDVEDGIVTIRGLKSIPAEQTWFWTEGWQAGEREASAQLVRGEGTTHKNPGSFFDSLQ